MYPRQFATYIKRASINSTFITKALQDQVENLNQAMLNKLTNVRKYALYGNPITGSISLPNVVTVGEYAFANTRLNEVYFSEGIQSIGTNAFQTSTITRIVIPKPEGSVLGAPWGATNAVIEWTEHIEKSLIASILDRSVSNTTRIYPYTNGGNGTYRRLAEVKQNDTPELCETLMAKGGDYGEYYQAENQIGAYRAITSESPIDIDAARFYLGRYSRSNKDLTVTIEYQDSNGDWVEIQDVEIARTIPYPTNYFDVSMPQGVDVYGVRWIHKKAPEKSRDNNISFFGTVLYKNGTVVPQYRNSGLSDALLETTNIRQYCFYNCVNIKGAIDLPNVENIGEYAFNGCNKITEVTLGANIRTISTTAFSGCSGITLITIQRAFGTVLGAPWGATNAQIVWTGEE
jgi:hypothetical protein